MQRKPTILCNGLIFSDGFRFKGTLIIEDGQIRDIISGAFNPAMFPTDNYEVIDCEGKMIMPGVIDEHVHFRDPGLTEKGDIATESRAAIAGGVTSFFDMPNTVPQTTTIAAWEEKMEIAAASSAANYAFFMGATNDNIDQIMAADYTRIPGVKLFLGSSTGNMLVDSDSSICSLFRNFHRVIACHAENEKIISDNRRKLTDLYDGNPPLKTHSEIRSRQACLEATRHAIELARLTGARLHVMHITTADELALFTPGDIIGKRITSETCPHYLYFTADSVEESGGLTKCNPAIKSDFDRRALRKAVATGRIDVIATDHAPHLLSQKLGGNALTAASGMPSVQFSLPLMLQLAKQGHFSYEDVVARMCNAPAMLFNVDRRGFIRTHYWADIVVVDPDADYEISSADVISRCGWTPYEGIRLNFRVEQTWVNGQLAYVNGQASPDGKPHFTGKQTPLAVRFSN